MKFTTTSFVTVFATLLAVSAPAQSPPDLMSYQGTLLQPSGQPEIGPKTLEFRIVDEGNTTVWGPQTFPDLPLQQGKFNVLLGATDDNGSTITLAFHGPGDAARFMSVKVAGEPTERLPLQRIASVPYALAVADGAVGTSALRDGSVTSSKLEEGSIGKRELSPVGIATSTGVVVANDFSSVPGSWNLGIAEEEGGSVIDVPGLSINGLTVSGTGRPVFVGLRRRVAPSSLGGDINIGANSGAYLYGEMRLSYTGGVQPSTAVGFASNSSFVREGLPASAFTFLIFPSPTDGPTQIDLKLQVLVSIESDPSFFSIREGIELYAFEM